VGSVEHIFPHFVRSAFQFLPSLFITDRQLPARNFVILYNPIARRRGLNCPAATDRAFGVADPLPYLIQQPPPLPSPPPALNKNNNNNVYIFI